MIDYYGTDADYIHLKFGRMQKAYNFTEKFQKEHPKFCEEYRKYWMNEGDKFKTPLDIAQYVATYNIPINFYYNYTDEPSESMADIFEYIIRECAFGEYQNGEYVGWDGEKEQSVGFKVTEVRGEDE